MEIFGINLVGILATTFIGMVLGALWYSPILFGKQWMEAIGKTPETIGSPTGPMIGSMMTAIGVSVVFSLTHVESLVQAIHIGVILGVLIIFPAMLSDSLFCGWGNRLLIIQAGYRILSVLLMSLALVYIV